VIDFGNARVLNVISFTGAAAVFMTVIGTGSDETRSRSTTRGMCTSPTRSGAFIWRTDPNGGTATPWVTDARLGTTGVPPFGAQRGSPSQGAHGALRGQYPAMTRW